MLCREFYINRREQYMKLLPEMSIGIEMAGDTRVSTSDECYPFEPFRNFYYLTGCDTPGMIYMAIKTGSFQREILFIERPDEKKILYEGAGAGAELLKEQTGIGQIEYLDHLQNVISRYMYDLDIRELYIDMGKWDPYHLDDPVQRFCEEFRRVFPYVAIRNIHQQLCALRPIKQPEEIEAHRKAAAVTTEAVCCMLAHIRPDMRESHIEGYYDLILKKYGCGHAFDTIAASGRNALTLHYGANSSIARDGDMILFDLGASYKYYCTDVSRTYPVNGRFTKQQRELYEVVLKGLDAAISLSKPGYRKEQLQQESKRVMAEELMKLGKIKKPEEIARYYKHGSGHLIGLNTHDEGDSTELLLTPGMMFTLEPGLYFQEEGIGIRIEDTLLVTEDGVEVLSESIPKRVDEIEEFMAKSHSFDV